MFTKKITVYKTLINNKTDLTFEQTVHMLEPGPVVAMLLQLFQDAVLNQKDALINLGPHLIEDSTGTKPYHDACKMTEMFNQSVDSDINQLELPETVTRHVGSNGTISFNIPSATYERISYNSTCPACKSRLDFFLYLQDLYQIYAEYSK